MSSLRFALSCTIFGVLALSPVLAHADPLDDHLSPRAEVSVKGGSDRSVLTTEFWAPLVQQSGRVVYTDLRLMGDDDDNREGNLGLGYRQVTDWSDSVLGGHIWIDRRRTEHNATFHQVTVGVESLGKVIDLRANGYIALNDAKVTTTPATGPLGPYLAGSGVFYNTNGSISETPQHGIDAEAGYRLPILQRYTDTIRIYGGGYHFFRDNTDSTTGYRIRTEAVINPVLSIGARFQHDGERGSQTFLEATLRFPFSAKKLYQTKGLYGRLDESPERDVDIVTAAKIDNGQRQILNNAGTEQRILYVDNSQTNGDGTIEHPFNNLTSAQAALQANDILYVKAGTGTTQGMDTGITISQPNVSLVGSGSPLTIQGITFLSAGNAPTITNINPTVDSFTGNGVFINASDVRVTGITVTGASRNGISYRADTGQVFEHATLDNITSINNGQYGMIIFGTNGGIVNNAVIDNVTALDNSSNGVIVQGFTNGTVGTATLSNITAIGNARNNVANGAGVMISSTVGNSSVGQVMLNNINSYNNASAGIRISAVSNGQIDSVTINNSISTSNRGVAGHGVTIEDNTGGKINTINVTNNVFSNNIQSGINSIVDGTGVLGTINVFNNTTNSNSTGVFLSASNGGVATQTNVQNITAANNTAQGIRFLATGAGAQLVNISASNLTANSNGSTGITVETKSNAVINQVNLSNITAASNTSHGLYILTQIQGTLGQISVSNANIFNNTSRGVYVNTVTQSIVGAVNLNGINTSGNINGIQLISDASGSAINNANLSNITANNNSAFGISANSQNSGIIDQLNINNVTTNNNADTGVAIVSATSGIVNNANLLSVTANNNLQNGILIQQGSTGSNITATISNSNLIGNVVNGIYLQKTNPSTSVLYNVSLGVFGNLANPGSNRIFNNGTRDLRINYAASTGIPVTAQNNWWGTASGLQPGRYLLTNATVDASSPLITDPR